MRYWQYKIMKHIYLPRCLFLFTILILALNIDFSFAGEPAYSCFILSKNSEKNGYKVDGAAGMLAITGNKNISSHQGWVFPESSFIVTDKKGENGIELTTRLRRKTLEMHSYIHDPNGNDRQSKDVLAGYIITGRTMGKKGLSITGCTNAVVDRSGVRYNQNFTINGKIYMLSQPCCVLTVMDK